MRRGAVRVSCYQQKSTGRGRRCDDRGEAECAQQAEESAVSPFFAVCELFCMFASLISTDVHSPLSKHSIQSSSWSPTSWCVRHRSLEVNSFVDVLCFTEVSLCAAFDSESTSLAGTGYDRSHILY